MVKNNQLKKQDSGQVDSDVLMIETEEINYDLDSDPEFNSELIKYEMNMIELPFFTKDCNVADGKARKYIFSERDNSYMKVTPRGDPDLISNKIPQEFDEKIFYGILKLSREQNSKEIVTDYFTLAKVSGVKYNHLERIKDSIQRLRHCNVEFNNMFYNAELKAKMDGNHDFSILQDKQEYTFKKVQNFPENKRKIYEKQFRNSKISEILILTLADYVYKNIEHKGFLYFNQKELLNIKNATARKTYLLITKWQGWEKKLTIKRACRFLASRIPLSWEKSNIPGTLNVLEKAATLLKRKKLIRDFYLTRTKPLANSYIEFCFSDQTNKVIEFNKKAASVTTGHENMAMAGFEDEIIKKNPTANGNKSNEIIQGELFEVIEPKEDEKEKELTEKAEKIISEMSEERLQDLKTSAYDNVRYTVDKHQVIEGLKTEEEFLKEIMVMIIRNELIE